MLIQMQVSMLNGCAFCNGVYKMRDGKIIESEVFQDTAAILRFLEGDE